ncbi:hypothetical protein EVAR_74548_1 [Eumeta japonica]|uniref:Uncharacterized protein n=1 Tax=Eumeta variegata TaxID=151549 RepID=A0A4C1TF44_EUMVA|nr:hypothetical protein EVAR_74548_1 [Eumeta japonica]
MVATCCRMIDTAWRAHKRRGCGRGRERGRRAGGALRPSTRAIRVFPLPVPLRQEHWSMQILKVTNVFVGVRSLSFEFRPDLGKYASIAIIGFIIGDPAGGRARGIARGPVFAARARYMASRGAAANEEVSTSSHVSAVCALSSERENES